MEASPGRWRLTGYDVAGLVAGGVSVLWATAVRLWLAPAYLRMFADFGGTLAPMTQFFASPWGPSLLSLVPVVLGAAGLLTSAPPRARAVLGVLAIGLALLLPLAFFAAMSVPLFRITEASIK